MGHPYPNFCLCGFLGPYRHFRVKVPTTPAALRGLLIGGGETFGRILNLECKTPNRHPILLLMVL